MAKLMVKIQNINSSLILQDEVDKQNMALLGIRDDGQPSANQDENVGQLIHQKIQGAPLK